jgi:hypothetical protein
MVLGLPLIASCLRLAMRRGYSEPLDDRTGRDDNSDWDGMWVPKPLFRIGMTVTKQNCHPDRSVPGFPAAQHWIGQRVRPSAKKGA